MSKIGQWVQGQQQAQDLIEWMECRQITPCAEIIVFTAIQEQQQKQTQDEYIKQNNCPF